MVAIKSATLTSLLVGISLCVENDENAVDFHNCDYCDCWYTYENRDVVQHLGDPFANVLDSITIDECLSLCARDYRCKSVTWGRIGGRDPITCELYSVSALSDGLQYQFGMNYYEPWTNMPCTKAIPAVAAVAIHSPPKNLDRIQKRKQNGAMPNVMGWK